MVWGGYFEDPALDYVEDTRTLTLLDWQLPGNANIWSPQATTQDVKTDVPQTTHNFTVSSSTSVIEIWVRGYIYQSASPGTHGSYLVVDNGTPIYIGGGPGNSNALGGANPIILRNLAPGTHTLKVQVVAEEAAGSYWLRPLLNPSESVAITVLEHKQGGKLGVAGNPVYFRPEKRLNVANDTTPVAAAGALSIYRPITPMVPGIQIIGGVMRSSVNGISYQANLRRASDLVLLGSATFTGNGSSVLFAFPSSIPLVAGTTYEISYGTAVTGNLLYANVDNGTTNEDIVLGAPGSTLAADGTGTHSPAAGVVPNLRLDYSDTEAGVLAPSSGTRTKPRKAMADYRSTTDLYNPLTGTVNTAVNIGPQHTFTLLSGASMTEIVVGGNLLYEGATTTVRVGTQIILDGDTANPIWLGGGTALSGNPQNALAGSKPIYLSDLPPGSHTLQIRCHTYLANSNLYLRSASIPAESVTVQVLEHGW